MGWKLHQMDVKTAFLNGEIEEVSFHHSREISIDARLEEKEGPAVSSGSLNEPPSPKEHREESEEGLDAPAEEPIERLLKDPPVKRRPT